MKLFLKIYYKHIRFLKFRFVEWQYKRKYGITMGEAMMEFGRNIILTEVGDLE